MMNDISPRYNKQQLLVSLATKCTWRFSQSCFLSKWQWNPSSTHHIEKLFLSWFRIILKLFKLPSSQQMLINVNQCWEILFRELYWVYFIKSRLVPMPLEQTMLLFSKWNLLSCVTFYFAFQRNVLWWAVYLSVRMPLISIYFPSFVEFNFSLFRGQESITISAWGLRQ